MQTAQLVQPIHVPEEWHDRDLLAVEQFCNSIHNPPRTRRAWRRRGIGPHRTKLEGCGRLDTPFDEPRRGLGAFTTSGRCCLVQSEGRKP